MFNIIYSIVIHHKLQFLLIMHYLVSIYINCKDIFIISNANSSYLANHSRKIIRIYYYLGAKTPRTKGTAKSSQEFQEFKRIFKI